MHWLFATLNWPVIVLSFLMTLSDGCYDIMHSGHYNAIRQARSLCDELVVGVHTNEEIMHHKGPPVMSDEERREAVRSCKWVNHCEFGVPYVPTIELLDRLQCDFCIHGDDMALAADGTDAFAEVKAAGRMAIVKRTEGISTTDLVNRLLEITKEQHAPDNSTTTTASSSTATASSSHTSNFLLSTWRISQFSNHRLPKPNDTVVYFAGSFDLFHLGHIEMLEEAKKLGTFLYVGIHDDTAARSYASHAPIMNLQERMLNVLACKYADEVIMGAPVGITQDLIKSLNVKVIAIASSNGLIQRPTMEDIPEAVKEKVQIQEVKSKCGLRTEDVVQRILENRQRYEKRNATRAAKDKNYLETKAYVQEK